MLVSELPLFLSDDDFINLENALYLAAHDVSGESRGPDGRWISGKGKRLRTHARRALDIAKHTMDETRRTIKRGTAKGIGRTKTTARKAAHHLNEARKHVSKAVRKAKLYGMNAAGPTVRSYIYKAQNHANTAIKHLKKHGRAASIHARRATYHLGKAVKKHGRAAIIHARRALHHVKLSAKHHSAEMVKFAKKHGKIAGIQSGRVLHRSKMGVGKAMKYAKSAVHHAGQYAKGTMKKFKFA